MHYPTPINLTPSLDAISPARLSSYRSFFRPASDQELYGLYCWNDVLSSNFMRLIGFVEVTLRNRFHLYLSQYASTIPTINGTPDSNDWYSCIGLTGKSEAKVRDVTHTSRYDKSQRKTLYTPKAYVSPNTVISSMTLGFWAPLLDLPLPWDVLTPQIFQKHRYASNPQYWKNKTHVGHLYERLNRVRDVRNRVAHFEPLWKLGDMLEEIRPAKGIKPIVEFAAPTNEVEVLARLRTIHDRIVQLLYWLSPDRASDYKATETYFKTTYLMTPEALDRFRSGDSGKNVRLSNLTKPGCLKRIMREHLPLVIYDRDQVIGYYHPLISNA